MGRVSIMFGLIFLVLLSMVSSGFAFCAGDTNCDGVVDGSDLAALATDFGATGCGTCDDVSSKIDELEARIAQLENLLASIRLSGDGKTVIFDGVNVQIVNGLGSTEAAPQNSLGNLIVGYNEERDSGNDRSGSHNVIIGRHNNYSSYAGLVVGRDNEIFGAYASVTAGLYNKANGNFSHVSGGQYNEANGRASCVSGGYYNNASGASSNVSGGQYNEASGGTSCVSGGDHNDASESSTTVAGGRYNNASGTYATVSGGEQNEASGFGSSVSGGNLNTASGTESSVSGGQNRSAVAGQDWAAGSLYENN